MAACPTQHNKDLIKTVESVIKTVESVLLHSEFVILDKLYFVWVYSCNK